MAGVVEAEPVDDRRILLQTEHAGTFVAGLRQRGDRADLGESESHPQERVRDLGVLVEARCHADRVREVEPERRHLEPWVGRHAWRRHATQPERVQGQPVRLFRVRHPEQHARQLFVSRHAARAT
ncbi:MAG: hypothetical protein PGN13_13600 [Patulibacter minatonensis]